jgi:ribonucleoside-diphosphate reductase alpha chain
MGALADDMGRIFDALKEGALTMQAGGGIGYDFSPLRPDGDQAATTGNIASGPVSFMRVWDAMCATISATGYRRGAMMATLAIDHPDIFQFVHAKADRRSLTHFNCSVLVSEAFMTALAAGARWPLRFGKRVYRDVDAHKLWDAITRNAYEGSEPGVLFVDRINAENNLGYREVLRATNPCGEVPLPPYGACQLGSFNLTAFVRDPFTPAARFDFAALAARVPVAVRLLDNLLDVSRYPLAAQRDEALDTRRIGLGFMGLGSALIMLGLHYDSDAARGLAVEITRTLRDAAYRASVEAARERGAFPAFDTLRYGARPFIARLPAELRADITRYGIRNSHLLAVAPTGTISLLANNVSSGIEPIFRGEYQRTLRTGPETRTVTVEEFARMRWRRLHGVAARLPDVFVTATELEPRAHLAMQAAVQPFVDQGISKTINVPESMAFEAFQQIYPRRTVSGSRASRPSARAAIAAACCSSPFRASCAPHSHDQCSARKTV